MKTLIIISILFIAGIFTGYSQTTEIPYELKYILTDRVENQYDTLVEVRIVIYESDYEMIESIDLEMIKADSTRKVHNKSKDKMAKIVKIDLTKSDQATITTRETLKKKAQKGASQTRAIELSCGVYNLSQVTELTPQVKTVKTTK